MTGVFWATSRGILLRCKKKQTCFISNHLPHIRTVTTIERLREIKGLADQARDHESD